MKKLTSLLLSILLSINFISYNPSVLYAEDVVSNDEIVEEIISDGSSEEIVLNDSKEELLSETDEEEIIVEEEDLETIVEEDVEELEFINDYRDVEYPNLPKHDDNYIPKNAAVSDSYFNLQDQGYITSIKDQAQYGTCWAHALCASAESTYLMAHKDVSASSLDLSEVLLTYFVKENEFPDKLGLVTNDKSWDDSSYTNNLFKEGHNDYVAMFNVASGIGLSKESKYPYSEVTKLSSFNRNNFINTINTEWCYDNDYYLINANVFDMSDEKDKIKEYLQKYGAMAVSYHHDNNYQGSKGAYYYNGGTSTNHAVTLIGWDDNYSKDNFTGIAKPINNGAWIIKNSWGANSGNKGIYYISYEDTSLNAGRAIQFFIEPEYEDDRIYQYDGTFSQDIYGFGSSSHYEANVYTAQRDEYINRVGFFTYGDNVTYKVYIYKGSNVSTNPSNGTLIYEQSKNKSVSTQGFHTVELDNEVLINKGEKFAIVIYMSGSTYNFVDDDYNTSTWYWTKNSYERGQSYYKVGTSGSWVDASTQKGNWEKTPVTLRVKGYTRDNLLVNNTNVYYDASNGLIIESDLQVLINQAKTVKIDGEECSFTKSNNKVIVSNSSLVGISGGYHTVTLTTEKGFTKTFDDVLISVNFNGIYLAFSSDIHNKSSDNTAPIE